MDLVDLHQFERSTLTWKQGAAMLRRNLRGIVGVFLATILVAYGALQFTTEQYETEAVLLVKVGRENAQLPASVESPSTFATTGVRKQEVNSEIRMLTSRWLTEAVVDQMGADAFAFQPVRPHGVFKLARYYVKLGVRWVKEQGRGVLVALNLKKELTPREKAIIAVQDALTVDSDKDSDVINVRLRLPSPELCTHTASTILQLFMDQHARVMQTPNVRQFFATALQDKHNQLLQLVRQREELRSGWGVISAADQRQLLLKQVSDLSAEIVANHSETDMLQSQQWVMKERLAKMPSSVPSSEITARNPTIAALEDRITALQVEHAKLASRYTDDAEPLKKVDEEIADLNAQVSKQQPTVVSSSTTEIMPARKNFLGALEENGVKIAGLEARNRDLAKEVAVLNQRLQRLNVGEDRLQDVERELTLAQQSYMNYASHMEQARISDELDASRIANVSVLSPPSTPIEPVYPKKALLMLIALAAGLLLGVGLALLLEYFSDTIWTSTDLEGIDGVPYLGTFQFASAAHESE